MSNLELVFAAVDDDGCDLLVEKDEYGREQRRNDGQHDQPPVRHSHRIDKPSPAPPSAAASSPSPSS